MLRKNNNLEQSEINSTVSGVKRKRKIMEQIAITVELMGHTITPAALAVLESDLSEYPEDAILSALKSVRNGRGRFTPDAVFKELEKLDGRPGPDEAWAMIPQDEQTSAVMTNEMAEALHIAQPLLNEGDKIAARMSFKEAYARITEANRRAKVNPTWFPSLGADKNGRDAVLVEAVRIGRLSSAQVVGLMSPDSPLLDSPLLALEYKQMAPALIRENITRMKAMLENRDRMLKNE